MTPAGQRILDVASELFYAEGIHAVGVATIADRAGVTKKTLYDCFGSKENLVVQYLRHRHDTWWAHLEDRLGRARGHRTTVLVDSYLSHPRLNVSRGCAFLNAAGELPADHPGWAVIREHKAAVRARLAELVAADAPDNTAAANRTLTEHVFLLLEGAVAHLGVDGNHRRLSQARTLTANLLS